MSDMTGINEIELTSISKTLLKYHDDIHEIFSEYKKIIENTSQYWNGEAANTFRTKFKNFEPNLDVVSSSFLDYSKALTSVIKKYNNMDLDSHNILK